MVHVFLDTNVILDYFLDRQPFSTDAARILTLSEEGRIKAYISTLTIANCHYLMRKSSSHKKAIFHLEKLCEFIELLDFPKSSVLISFKSDFSDFEDALQNDIARSKQEISTIITRNVIDFKKSSLNILTPKQFINSVKTL